MMVLVLAESSVERRRKRKDVGKIRVRIKGEEKGENIRL